VRRNTKSRNGEKGQGGGNGRSEKAPGIDICAHHKVLGGDKQSTNRHAVDRLTKGDTDNPEYRSKIVAQEINTHKQKDLFAATPPLEAKIMLISLAMTEGIGFRRGVERNRMKLKFIDIWRAYFHAKARRQVFIEQPPEDAEEGICRELCKSMST
jgi:hypothetical protein